MFTQRVCSAVKKYWKSRSSQSSRRGKKSQGQAGTRNAVLGGKHLDDFVSLIEEVALSAGFRKEDVCRSSGLELPGYFRAQKRWDVVLTRGDRLCAAVELKSQVGSFGNNFNNRSEEAIGSSTDLWTAFREGALGKDSPWLGYFFLLEDAPKAKRPVGLKASAFKPLAVFEGTSYAQRYAILCERLVLERKYTKAALLFAPRGIAGDYSEAPDPSLGLRSFLGSLHAHLLGCR